MKVGTKNSKKLLSSWDMLVGPDHETFYEAKEELAWFMFYNPSEKTFKDQIEQGVQKKHNGKYRFYIKTAEWCKD